MSVDQWGRIYNVLADETTIANKTDIYKPIVSNKVDYAVKQGLAYSKLAGSGYAWTDEEKASARTLLGAFGSKGGVISGDVTITGNITQQGEVYETHAEQVYSTKDYIYLREGNTGGLAEGAYTGFEFKNYDGEGNNGRLVVDKSGVARVGDAGDEQPLATREEAPLAGGFAKWDSATNKFITTTSDVVTTSGDQTISGVKSFENEIRVVGPGYWEGIAIHNSNYALGDTLTAQMPLGRWITYDKNGTYASVLQTVANTNNVNATSIASVQKNTDGSLINAGLSLWAVKDGAPQVRATGHLLPASDSHFHIGSDTLKWQNMYLAGDIEAHSPNTRVFAIKNTGVSLYENPTSNTLLGGLKVRSKENAYLTTEETWRLANGGVRWAVGLRNNTGTVTGASGNTDIYKTMLTAELHKDGSAGLYTNTPDASSNSTQIATTAWVNTATSNLFKLKTGGRPADINFAYTDVNKNHMRLDLVSSTVTANRPAGDGYLMTFFWDSAYEQIGQLFMTGGGAALQIRGNNQGNWTSWRTFADLESAQTFTGTKTFNTINVTTINLKS
jgi:hypothetical protein